MSEFVDFSDHAMRPLGEVMRDAYDRTREFIGELATQAGIVYQEQDSEQPPAPQIHVCGTSCSRCGHGGEQKRYQGRG
jgi:hypothetical protein